MSEANDAEEGLSLKMSVQVAIRDLVCQNGLLVGDWQLLEVLSFGGLVFYNKATGESKILNLKVTD